MRNTKIALAAAAALMAWGLVAAGCAMDDGEPGGNIGTADVVDITFGKISASSTQEQVTGTIRSSLELLQAQTQNIINKLTEHKATLQKELDAVSKQGLKPQYDAILAKMDVITNIIGYENTIKSAQQIKTTAAGFSNMNSYYGSVLGEAAKLFDKPVDGQIFFAKMAIYSVAVTLDERGIISVGEEDARVNRLKQDIYNVRLLEGKKGNDGYFLPDPETNMSGLRLQLENEGKQALGDDKILGEYGQYIFYQGEDMAEYDALLSDAYAAGKAISLP